jgi:hypothetical protein
MGGLDPAKLANLNHKSLKYEVGRILQYHPNTPEGLRAALPVRGERIGIVDVIFAAGEGGKSWQWLTE